MANSLIDFGIVQPEAAGSFLRGFQGAQALAQQQAEQQQKNQLAALQLQAAQRGEEDAMAEREAYKGAATLDDVQQRLMQAGLVKQSIALQKQIQDQRAAKIKQAQEELKIGKSIAERAFSAGQAAKATAPGSEKQAILSLLQQYQGRGIDLSQDMAEIANLPDNLVLEHVFNRSQELKNLAEMVTTDTGEAIIRAPKLQAPGMASQSQLPVGAFQGPQQQVMNQLAAIADPAERAAATQAYQRQLMTQAPAGEVTRIQKSLTPAQKLQEQRAQRQLELAEQAANPEFQQRMAAAKATGEAIAKGDITAQQAMPKIIGRAEEGLRLIDELVGKRDEKGNLVKGSKPHPGFENAVGATWLPFARFVPGTDAAGFMSRFDQIKGASFLEAFESLKGGGAITEKEGQKGTDAINRMSIATDEKEFVRAAMDLKNIIQKGVENAQKRAAKFGGASSGAPVAPAAPAAGGAKFLGFE